MAAVTIAVNGRSYRFECSDEDKARFEEVAAYVTSRMDGLIAEHGNVGSERLLVMTALMIADDLWDATAGDSAARTTSNPDDASTSGLTEVAKAMRRA